MTTIAVGAGFKPASTTSATVMVNSVDTGSKPAPTPIHRRRVLRLQGYDYSQAGAYFVTLCVHNRECLFGEIVAGEMRLNSAGHLLQTVWLGLPDHYSHAALDSWVIMPNHAHGIIVLDSCAEMRMDAAASLMPASTMSTPVGAGFKPAPTTPISVSTAVMAQAMPMRHGLPEIVRALKTFSARRINAQRQTPGARLWQRNYWEHVIRNDTDLEGIREYIHNNPAQWELDKLNPCNQDRL